MSDKLPLVGEPLPLDLINTLANGPAGEVDLLDSTEGFHPWLDAQAGRLARPAPAPGEIDLDALRALRGRIGAAVDCAREGVEPPAQALRALTRAQLAGPLHRELTWADGSVTAARVRTGSATDVLLAELADATVDLLTDPVSLGRVRRCEGPGCRLLFLAVNPRRRWCSPVLCGNRVRVGRYYQRHKEDAG
ncbi:CGNR zinc finger domain-containing protein [Streptomyces sp. NPDC087440]|uniref:CGNR zinc finger domain-containing protein n=1 Tax=Streptomyces sp. NPDC087440 TaxID=3365790 RepID=UPI00381E2A44